MKGNTKNRILVASLLLFNEHGEPQTTTNEIADEVDISPGNLHYHFRRKEHIVAALLDEFRADAGRVLNAPGSESVTLDDFWIFLHHLLEFAAAYRFLFRDLETLTESYPEVGRTLGHFAKGLAAMFEIYLRHLSADGVLDMGERDARLTARNFAVISLFSERFDQLTNTRGDADERALRIAGSILGTLRPFATDAGHIDDLAGRYAGDERN
jgi:AcrR family transcriptional regulator